MIINKLYDKQLLSSMPKWMLDNMQMVVKMGSHAYGTENNESDIDLYCMTIPRKEHLFPHLTGHLFGFDFPNEQKFNKPFTSTIIDESAHANHGQEYDITIFGITKYFSLLREANPNILESLYVPLFCVLHLTGIGQILRERRSLFLSKLVYRKLKNYAYSQLHKLNSKEPEGNRKEIVEKHGFDTKFAMNLVRLADKCEQLLAKGDLDLQANKDHLKAIKRGDVPKEDILAWFKDKERHLEELYLKTSLPEEPRSEEIKQLLLNCLEHHYGNLSEVITRADKHHVALTQIRRILDENGIN